MSYQVLARKWRPQRFEDVLGQQAVTRTLRNALKSKRIAQAFVFAGPRGCGKTTSARILARALNCVNGPTPDPCGVCEPCVEIAEGRDMDVLEIDAATHTGVDNVREVIIEGLSIAPVRNRYKVFIIDEVHMLSASSFNALLKSIEEPPPHVVFMMATTELHKIPDTVLSRAQVHEFRTISARTVADRLHYIAEQEQIDAPDAALMLLARAGEGSMRDSLSALDQVRAFAGEAITVEDVVAVLGLVGRDLVLDMLEAVVAEDAPAAFALTEKAIERGYDLRLLCRELSRAIRDLLILSVDKSRASDPEIAGDADRDRVVALVDRWSREDLLRAFDLLTKVEQEIRSSDQPRFNMEMALLRLMHLRKLVPLTELIQGAQGVQGAQGARGAQGAPGARSAQGVPRRSSPTEGTRAEAGASALRAPAPRTGPTMTGRMTSTSTASAARAVAAPSPAPPAVEPGRSYKDALLSAIKSSKPTFYNLVVAQAYRIDASDAGLTFTFQSNQKMPRQQCEEHRAWLQSTVETVVGKPLPVTIAVSEAPEASSAPAAQAAPEAAAPDEERRQKALEHETVRTLLEVFPVEKTSIE